MFYFVADKSGKYVKLRGLKKDLKLIYEVFSRYAFINDTASEKHTNFKSRSSLNSHFLYEIRHCYKGDRSIIKDTMFDDLDESISYECMFSWVYILFFINSIRRNMCFCELTKLDQSIMLFFEYWIEKAMMDYDGKNANNLVMYINHGISTDNKYIYQFMRKIDDKLISMPNGKKTFRNIPNLLRASNELTKEYIDLMTQLLIEASDNNIDIENLDWNEIEGGCE